uniref:F-box domain-containing protein n=1 Tax=Quercus lobata TaxID=97700 RepID=A0A7N2KKM0_QUELO
MGERFRKIRKFFSKAWKTETKAKCSSACSWSDLPPELLGLILRKVPFVDTIRCKAVCSSWRFAITQSKAQPHSIQSTPWLMLPSDQEGDFTTSRFFNLAEKKTSSDFLIIQHTIGNFVNAEGDVDEYYLLSSSGAQPLVCPYRTKLFCVYKLDFSKKMLEKVESLKDQVMFLGGNQSMSLSSHDFSECVSNSIYFTNDQ